MEEHGDDAQAPDGGDGGPQAPDKNGGEDEAEGQAAFGGPLEPVVVGLIGEGTDVDESVARIDRGPGAETDAEPGVGGDHVECREVELEADLHWIGSPEAVPDVLIADHHGEEGEQGGDAENGSADLTGVDAAADPHDRDDGDELGRGQHGAGAGGRGDDRGVQGGSHRAAEQGRASAAQGFVDGEGENRFNKGGVVVARQDGSHHIVGIAGREEPEDFAAGGEGLDGGQDRHQEGEPQHGGAEPAAHARLTEEEEGAEKDGQKGGPAKDRQLRVKSIGSAPGEPLEQAPGDREGQRQERISKRERALAGAVKRSRRDGEDPDLKDRDRPISADPKRQDGKEKERRQNNGHARVQRNILAILGGLRNAERPD